MIREWKKNQELSKETIINSIKAYNKFISIDNLTKENIQSPNEEIETIQSTNNFLDFYYDIQLKIRNNAFIVQRVLHKIQY